MATKYLAKTFKYGAVIQTNWATPAGVAAAFKTIPYNAGSVTFDPGVGVGIHNTSGQSGIHKESERFYVDGRSGLAKIGFSMPADVLTLAPHLGQALLTVSQGAGAAYTKTITCAGLTGTVDFNGNDVKLFSVAMDDKASTDDGIILENAIIENLNLSWDFNANGTARLLQMDGNWVGNEMNFEQTMTSGNWTTSTFTPMNNTDLYTMSAFTVDGVGFTAQDVRRFTFSVANNVTTNASTTAGKANNYDIAPVYKSTIILDYNATTEKVLKDFQDGAEIAVTITSSISVGTVGHLSFVLSKGFMQKQPFIYNGEFAGIELDVLWHSVAAATPVAITLTDTIDWGY